MRTERESARPPRRLRLHPGAPSRWLPESRGSIRADYFPYKPRVIAHRPRYRDLATATNVVRSRWPRARSQADLARGQPDAGGNALLVQSGPRHGPADRRDASQRPHGQLANDGDRNIVDVVDYILADERLGVVETRTSGSSRPVNSRSRTIAPATTRRPGDTGVHRERRPAGDHLDRPAYKHTTTSDVNLSRLAPEVEFLDRASERTTTRSGSRMHPTVCSRR